jgi:MerR family transcriptional regulator, copper efflux regulator
VTTYRSAPRPAPITCTLTSGDQADRIAQWERLLAGARVETVEGGLRFQLSAELAGRVAELAAAEQSCCAFFTFVLRLDGDGLSFEVRAPAEATPLLVEVFGTTA